MILVGVVMLIFRCWWSGQSYEVQLMTATPPSSLYKVTDTPLHLRVIAD